ncbi:uncharacterized protein TNCV_2012561 [Trichonephila clavipes]|nr:uncharacterized protein TNCV_2012561 [Trichonephila clavipes]
MNNHDVQELWFQQDGATCHAQLETKIKNFLAARATIDLLKDTFGDRIISCFGPVNWAPRSCDLTPLDYFLWDYVKSLVYADKPQTLTIWKTTFAVLLPIYGHKCWEVIENWMSRLDYIRTSRGSHMPEIIFKMYCLKIIFRIKKYSCQSNSVSSFRRATVSFDRGINCNSLAKLFRSRPRLT